MTVIAALHDLNLAGFFCDQLIFLKQGRLLHRGTVDEVLQPEVIREVYGVESEVRMDAFAGCSQVSFRAPEGLTITKDKCNED